MITMPNTRRVGREDQNIKSEHIKSAGEAFPYALLKKDTTGKSQNQISHFSDSRMFSEKLRQHNDLFNSVMEQLQEILQRAEGNDGKLDVEDIK